MTQCINKLHSFFLCCLFFASHIHSMEQKTGPTPNGFYLFECPKEIQETIYLAIINNVHHNVTTSTEARNYVCSVSLVNKQCNEYINKPENIRTIIHHLSHKIKPLDGSEEIAQKLNTPGSRNYILQSTRLFNTNLTHETIEQLTLHGADVAYTCNHSTNRNFPLLFWVQEKKIDVIKKLLELGADIDETNEYNSSCLIHLLDNTEILELLLSYKPKKTSLTTVAQCNTTNEVFSMLLNATIENSDNVQLDLNRSLQAEIHTHRTLNKPRVQLLLDAGAQPEYALKRLCLWMLRFATDPQETRQAPSLDILQLLCNYPISDEISLADTRNLVENVKDMADTMLKILDTCVKK